MSLYINKEGQVFKKSGIDFLVSKGLHSGDGLTSLTQEDFAEMRKPSNSDLVLANYEEAKITLAKALSEDIESGGYTWQVRNERDLANIQKVIDQNDRANYPSGTTQSFRMADNTWQDLTIDYFHQVLSDEAMRTRDLYDAYKTWTEGDMLEEFEI